MWCRRYWAWATWNSIRQRELWLVNAVLSRKFMPFDRSIDMHVSKVRRKLGDSEENGDHIKTIRGVGYMFARPAAKAKK